MITTVQHLVVTIVVTLIELTGPAGQVILVNPAEVVTVRAPRVTEHFGPGIRCLINTADGKFTAVIEVCEVVRELMRRGRAP